MVEIQRLGTQTSDRVLDSIYFGGGTPSLMAPETVATILDAVHKTWRVSNRLEITLEANPTSVEADRFRGYRDAGVNRVSVGLQALRDPDLKALGRLHSVAEGQRAVELALKHFDRASFDLIYARQDQSLADWRMELAQALSMGMEHLSLYQLTVEPGTAFGDRLAAGGLAGLPEEDLAADFYDVTQELCDAAGLAAYEISNHAAPDQESRHNLIYWRGGDYAGIGPGAHGRLTFDGIRYASTTPLGPTAWLDQVELTGNGEDPREALHPRDWGNEYIMMGLRTLEGISISRHASISKSGMDDNNIKGLLEFGVLKRTDDRLIATKIGRPILNAVIKELLLD